MRTEIKDVDPRDAAAFVQDIIDDLEITRAQASALTKVMRTHGLKVEIWEDTSGYHNASPDFSG